MEFLPMKRYRPLNVSRFPPFNELRTIKPVVMTMDLEVWKDSGNCAYLDKLAAEGLEIFPVRRILTENSKADRLDFPRRVLFEMTSICNTICLMCPQVNLKRKLVHMDKEKYKKVIDELDSYGLEGLWLYHFGESLGHPDFKELIEYVNTKSNLGYIWLSTNGILLDRMLIKFLIKSSLGYINFSLQSISVENYKKIAPRSPAEKILSNLNDFIELKSAMIGSKPFFRLQIIEQHNTVDELDMFLSRYFDKCDLISINMLEHTDIAFNKKGVSLRVHQEKSKCKRLSRDDGFINSDGSVTICDNAYNNELDMGNIWDDTLYNLWNGEERKRILNMNTEGTLWDVPLCSACTDYDL